MRLVRSLLVMLLVALTGCAAATTPRATPVATTQQPAVEISDQPQVVFNWATQRCSDEEHPDLPVRAFRDAQGQVQLTISSPTNYRLIGPSFESLTPDCHPVLVSANDRDPSHYNTWNWLGATYTLDGTNIYAVVHQEYHADQVGAIWQADQDFLSVQGSHNWSYQSWNGATYTNMTFDAAHARWQGSRPLCQVGDRWMHPDASCEPSRTWISPISGAITISGAASDLDSAGGDGVVASIFKGNQRLWSATIENGTTTRAVFDLQVSVRAGDAIHFRVNARATASYDTTSFNPSINIGSAPCPSGDHNLCQLLSLTSAVSTDGGKTYTQPPDPHHLLATLPYQYQPEAMRALWQPSNIVKNPNDGYYYLLVQRDEHGPATNSNVQGTCVLRTTTLDEPTSWRAWDGVGFSMRLVNPYQEATANPTDHTCALVAPSELGALTYSLTYNTYLGKFLAVGVRGDGFYYALSDDLVHWTPARLLMRATQGFANGFTPPYYAYPSLIDPASSSRNFETSGQTPYLYYSRFNSLSPLSIDLLRVRLTLTA